VLVADTAPGGLNTGGTLYALAATSGRPLWNLTANDTAQQWWGFIGASPAWDSR
jgi:hypothetical protein